MNLFLTKNGAKKVIALALCGFTLAPFFSASALAAVNPPIERKKAAPVKRGEPVRNDAGTMKHEPERHPVRTGGIFKKEEPPKKTVTGKAIAKPKRESEKERQARLERERLERERLERERHDRLERDRREWERLERERRDREERERLERERHRHRPPVEQPKEHHNNTGKYIVAGVIGAVIGAVIAKNT